MNRMHHSTIAHFRRSMQMDEEAYNAPPVADFSFFSNDCSNIEAAQASAAVSSSESDLGSGRDTAVTQNLNSIEMRNPIVSEKTFQCLQSFGNGSSTPMVC